MKKLIAYLGIKITLIGIWLYDNNTEMTWDKEDNINVKKLWELHDKFKNWENN